MAREFTIPASLLKQVFADKSSTDLHNEQVEKILHALFEPMIAGGTFGDVLVTLESLVVGTMLVGEARGFVTPTLRKGLLDLLRERVDERLATLSEG